MFIKNSLKGAATCAVMFLGLSGASYAGDLDSFLFGEGSAGFHATQAGDYAAADRDFSADYKNNPNSDLAQFNMADTYRQRGDNTNADALYRQAAVSGRGDVRIDFIEGHDSRTTVADLACRHLSLDHQTDLECSAQEASR